MASSMGNTGKKNKGEFGMTKPGTITGWYASRWDKDNGDIEYHAHGPEDSFVVFQGPYAKNDCTMFMKVMEGQMQ